MIAPTFHLNILKTFVPLFYENSRDLVTRLKSEVGKEFDCHDYLSAVTVDILLETAMGTRNTKDDRAGYDYAMAVMEYDVNDKNNKLFQFYSLANTEFYCFFFFCLAQDVQHYLSPLVQFNSTTGLSV